MEKAGEPFLGKATTLTDQSAWANREGNIMPASFDVLLTGLQFRKDRQDVKNNLAKLFKCEPDRIEALLGRAPVAMKTGVSLETALKYQKPIDATGAECRVKARDE
jgi:hypothetical protein